MMSMLPPVGGGLAGLFGAFLLTGSAWAADCRLDSVVCKEGLSSDPHYVEGQTLVVPCKTIGGYSVCLSEIGKTCWGKHKSYTCLKPNSVNYCQPFIDAQPACWQTNSECAQMDTLFTTGCMKYAQTWRCSDSSVPTPSNTIRLSDSYTLLSSNYDPGPCQSLADNANCSIAQSQCVSTEPSSPLPPGIDPSQVAPDGCYMQQDTYTCLTGRSDSSECDGFASNPNCTLQSTSQCDPDDLINGNCLFEQRQYRCMSQPPKTSTVTDCLGQLFCQNGNCFDKGYPADTDFARSMALLEAAREAGVYGSETEVFSGFDSRCKIKLFGLANCCKKSGGGGGMSNAHMALGAAVRAGAFFGSPYMYDAMFASEVPWLVDKAVDAWNAGAWTSTTSFYGLQFSFSSSAGLQFVGFDPSSFMLSVGIMVLQEMLSCGQSEQILAMKRGQNLCVEVGTYCSRRVLRICVERTKSFCCYNSRLARIINEQGRAQLGRGWGGAENPNCSGFTPSEFASIDLSRIDLSEFTAEIMANVRMPEVGATEQQIQSSVQQKVQNYYQR